MMHGTLRPGDALRTAETVTVHGSALITLNTGGTLRIARGSIIRALNPYDIELLSGQLYVDLPTRVPRVPSFTVSTSLGSIEHVGTQFEVTTGAHELSIRVREGEVRVRRSTGTENAKAGTELIVPRSGLVVRRSVATFGRQWAWVEALAPDYDVENRPLAEFLDWAARETGRRLEISDTHARQLAEQTRLHGSVRDLTPVEALDAALSATSLRFELREDTIRVSSGG
jgi:ferric-dicitrate binding protein FerR (iron transport regulator)